MAKSSARKKNSARKKSSAVKTRTTQPKRRKARSHARGRTSRRWSARVTRESDALDLDKGVFTLRNPKKIASSLKRSAQRSKRRKTDPYRSALSMLVFYINRAGKNLSASRKRTLNQAKEELREQFGRD